MALGTVVARVVRWLNGEEASKDTAKSRLQLILIQDRASVDPQILAALRDDLLLLMRKYFDVSDEEPEVDFQHEGDSMALVANIPIVSIKGRNLDAFGASSEAEAS
ncbi:MAG: cell division topological specificity factor MinE [Candidatus Poribacteria bacterium]